MAIRVCYSIVNHANRKNTFLQIIGCTGQLLMDFGTSRELKTITPNDFGKAKPFSFPQSIENFNVHNPGNFRTNTLEMHLQLGVHFVLVWYCLLGISSVHDSSKVN